MRENTVRRHPFGPGLQDSRRRNPVHRSFGGSVDRLGGRSRTQRCAGLPHQAHRHEPPAAVHTPHHRQPGARTRLRTRGSSRTPLAPFAQYAYGTNHRHLAADGTRTPADRQGGAVRGARTDHGRKRHRQRACRPLAARQKLARRGAVRRGELRGHPLGADRKRTLRTREGCLHLGDQTAQRQIRAGRRRHALHGRDRRHVAGGCARCRRTRSAAWAATRTSTWTCG